MSVAENLARVQARIGAAAARSGRSAQDVTVVAVSKGIDAARIPDRAGWILGENRVQELLDKQDRLAGRSCTWHFIGPLQRNKVGKVVGRVELIHSVDSERLGRAIGRAAERRGEPQPVLLEVNTSGEATKHGVAPERTRAVAADLAGIDGLILRGLMTMAAPGDLEAARTCFATLRRLRDELDLPGASELSMGMSGDFEVAIEEGATIVRIGTAIFGPREAPR